MFALYSTMAVQLNWGVLISTLMDDRRVKFLRAFYTRFLSFLFLSLLLFFVLCVVDGPG